LPGYLVKDIYILNGIRCCSFARNGMNMRKSAHHGLYTLIVIAFNVYGKWADYVGISRLINDFVIIINPFAYTVMSTPSAIISFCFHRLFPFSVLSTLLLSLL